MPLYVIERTFAEQLDLTDDDVKLIEDINADEGVRWLFSFLSADRRRTYCLYEAPSPEAIMAAATRAGVPVDAIVEVGAAVPQFTGRLSGLGRRPDQLTSRAPALRKHPAAQPAQATGRRPVAGAAPGFCARQLADLSATAIQHPSSFWDSGRWACPAMVEAELRSSAVTHRRPVPGPDASRSARAMT